MNVPFHVDLDGKTAVVTGGSGVLGKEMAFALAACGAKVAVIGRSKDKLDIVVKEIKENHGKALAVPANVLSKVELQQAYQTIQSELGACDILINGAGGNHPSGTTTKDTLEPQDLHNVEEDTRTFFDLDEDGVDFVMRLNFLGTLLPSQVFTKQMAEKGEGVIINVSSMNAFSPLTRIPAYSGAKAAVSNFTQWLAVHLAPTGVRVNAIAPGFFLTEQNRSLLLKEDGSLTERADKILSQTPAERFGRAEELTGTLLWLADNRSSSFVNGIVVPIDGGFSAYSGV
ncbi:SDR family oxidoreductase [Alteribacillus sp. HJP-4]|uniref:SDR family oxidoreductase n=1 Tax=Alteribacillus sp. HJP-4 TaxID=2775394 RepID=UPI0035CD1DBA